MCRWAVIEPAFWIGQMRTYIGTYIDHLSSIIGFERFRAGQFCIRHYCTVGLDSKEANNEELAEGVTEILPHFALEEGAVAIGEIGCDEQTELEDRYFRLQLELAEELDLPVMIHTPHRDKKRGTNKTFHVCGEHGQDTGKGVVDRSKEEPCARCSTSGYRASFSIFPSANGQCTYGRNSAGVWGRTYHGRFRLRLGNVGPLGVAKTF